MLAPPHRYVSSTTYERPTILCNRLIEADKMLTPILSTVSLHTVHFHTTSHNLKVLKVCMECERFLSKVQVT